MVFWCRKTNEGMLMRGLLMLLIGVPVPIIIIYELFF